MRETRVWSLGREDPLEKGMATHSSIPAWRIPGTEEPGGLQSMGSQRVRHDWEFLRSMLANGMNFDKLNPTYSFNSEINTQRFFFHSVILSFQELQNAKPPYPVPFFKQWCGRALWVTKKLTRQHELSWITPTVNSSPETCPRLGASQAERITGQPAIHTQISRPLSLSCRLSTPSAPEPRQPASPAGSVSMESSNHGSKIIGKQNLQWVP